MSDTMGTGVGIEQCLHQFEVILTPEYLAASRSYFDNRFADIVTARTDLAALRARCETAEAERDMLHAALDAYDAGRADYARSIARDACPFDERDVRESWEHGWDRSAAEARVAELEAALNAVCNRLEGDTIRGYRMHISAEDRDALDALADHAGDADEMGGKDGAT